MKLVKETIDNAMVGTSANKAKNNALTPQSFVPPIKKNIK
jgi:hypothetical protein